MSFPDSDNRGHYFIKGRPQGKWTAELPDYFAQRLSQLQRKLPDFDANITGMLFGKGKTNICLFQNGFSADLDVEIIRNADHPLYKVRNPSNMQGAAATSYLSFIRSSASSLTLGTGGASSVGRRSLSMTAEIFSSNLRSRQRTRYTRTGTFHQPSPRGSHNSRRLRSSPRNRLVSHVPRLSISSRANSPRVGILVLMQEYQMWMGVAQARIVRALPFSLNLESHILLKNAQMQTNNMIYNARMLAATSWTHLT